MLISNFRSIALIINFTGDKNNSNIIKYCKLCEIKMWAKVKRLRPRLAWKLIKDVFFQIVSWKIVYLSTM